MSAESIAGRATSVGPALRWLFVWRHPRLWLAYSIAFGVVAPIVCFAVATTGGWFGLATLPLDLYVIFSTAAMAAWLAFGGTRPWLNAVARGMFFGGALFAIPFVVVFGTFGVGFLGISIWYADSRMAAIGILGVQPILAFVAYAVNASRATRANSAAFSLSVVAFVVSALLPTGAWLALANIATATERAILESDRPLEEMHVARWRYFAPGHDWPRITEAYAPGTDMSGRDEPSTPRERRLADAFVQLTGRPIWQPFAD